MGRSRRVAPDECDTVMEAESDAQTIVARAKIGSARGNTNGHLLHSYAADTRPLTRRRERDRGSVATPRFNGNPSVAPYLFRTIPLEHRNKNEWWMD